MHLNLDGHVVLVTGGTSGVGLVTTHLLAEEGASVMALARSAPAEGVLPESASFVAADLARPQDAQRSVATTLERHGRVDGLVNNAALFETRDSFEDIDDDLWRRTFEVTWSVSRA